MIIKNCISRTILKIAYTDKWEPAYAVAWGTNIQPQMTNEQVKSEFEIRVIEGKTAQ